MAILNRDQTESIVAHCRDNRQAIVDSLNANLGSKFDLVIGKPVELGTLDSIPAGPGLVATFVVGDKGGVCIIPETLPLPPWYRNPNESQQSRLQTLAMEWSMALFPPDLEVEEFATVPTENLRKHLVDSRPGQEASLLTLQLQDGMTGQQVDACQMIWPVNLPIMKPADNWNQKPARTVAPETATAPPRTLTDDQRAVQKRRNRVMKIPVDLIVRIADRRIDVGQLRNITAGTLLTFERSAESPLDVYVGSKLYGRGEVVKVGENFGVKINEVNTRVVREPRIHRI